MAVDALPQKQQTTRYSLLFSSTKAHPHWRPFQPPSVCHRTLSFIAALLSFLLSFSLLTLSLSFSFHLFSLSLSLLSLQAQFVLCVNVCSDMAIKWRLNLETLEYWAVIEAVKSLIVLWGGHCHRSELSIDPGGLANFALTYYFRTLTQCKSETVLGKIAAAFKATCSVVACPD